MVSFKPEVRVAYFHRGLGDVLEYVSVWSLRTRIDVEVNSINDSTHGDGSLHAYDLALDLDTAGDRAEDLKRLFVWLARYLPDEYDVVLEADHIHVELDRRRKPAPSPIV